jgi:hypothetical protein
MLSTKKSKGWVHAAAVVATVGAAAMTYYVYQRRRRAKDSAPPRTRGGHIRADADTIASKCFSNTLQDWDAALAAAGKSPFLRLEKGNVARFDPAFLERQRRRLQQILQGDLLSETAPVPSPMIAPTVYLGNPGIAYALLRLASFLPEQRQACLDKVGEVLARPLVNSMPDLSNRTRISLQIGEAGACTVDALRCHSQGDHENAAGLVRKMLTFPDAEVPPIQGLWNRFQWWMMNKIYSLLAGITMRDVYDANEWLYGRAGYLHACELLLRTLQQGDDYDPELLRKIRTVRDDVVRATISCGRAYAKANGKASPLMYRWAGGEYLGAAHGIMGILHSLLDVVTEQGGDGERIRQDLRACVDFVLTKEQFLDHEETMGGHYGSLDDDKSATMVQFCHGATGAVWLFSKAYEVFGDVKYKGAALRSGGAIWRHGLLKKGPGICHGMSGSGYAMLRLFRLERDPKWLHRACAMSEYMLSEEVVAKSRKPDNPVSLFEGAAGTALFLADVLRPSMATMPLFELPEYEDVGSATTMEEVEGCSIAVVVK